MRLPIRIVILACFAMLSLAGAAPARPAGDELSAEQARVEGWWLASAGRFEEANAMLASAEGVSPAELELVDALGEFTLTLMRVLADQGKGCTFKLRTGDVVKGKPVEFTDGNVLRLHNKSTVRLDMLAWDSVALLAKSRARRKGPEAEAICAVAYLMGGDEKKARGSLKKAGGPHLDAAKKFHEDWPGMQEEIEARGLAGLVIDGDAKTFRPAAERLRDEYRSTAVYERLQAELRDSVTRLLREEGAIGGGLNALENTDLGSNRRRLIYGFVTADECKDWELLSFEQATADLHKNMMRNMLAYANAKASENGMEPIDVEQPPEIMDDTLVLNAGSAIRHRLRFKGSISVSCEMAFGGGLYSLPYAIVHGSEEAWIFAYFWRLSVQKPGGFIQDAEAEDKDSWPLGPPSLDIDLTVKKTREGVTAKLIYEDEDRGQLDVAGVEEGYALFGAIGADTANINRIIIEGEVIPESMDSLAETRILQEAERLVP
jgi:hypothetical protein